MNGNENHNRRAENLRKLEEFVSNHRGWELKHVNRRGDCPATIASRNFKYQSGHSALLWIHYYDDDRFDFIEAHVSLPFSAGPEQSISERKLTHVLEWAQEKDKVLSVPLALQRCDRFESAVRASRAIDRAGDAWYIIASIFDMDPFALTPDQIRIRLICLCAPHAMHGVAFYTTERALGYKCTTDQGAGEGSSVLVTVTKVDGIIAYVNVECDGFVAKVRDKRNVAVSLMQKIIT